tara:strand:- start:1164 stop:4976 length:3813 start_codon:yes stop_codon:yes gene_type:complete
MTDQSDLEFQVISWHSDNQEQEDSDDNTDSIDSDDSNYNTKFKKDTSKFIMYLFGKDFKENTYCLKVTDFTPYFYVLLPDTVNKYTISSFERWVKTKMWAKYRDNLLRCTFHKKKKFRNFDKQRNWNFARLVFSNVNSMRNAQTIFQDKKYDTISKRSKLKPKKITIDCIYNKPFEYSLFENMVDPLLKFIHHRDIDSVGWIRVPKYKYYTDDNNTRSDHLFTANWKDVKSIKDRDNTKIKVMSYDIEADSSHGDFPLPKKDYTKLAREIYSTYSKINNAKNSKNIRDNYTKYINNPFEFCEHCIESAFLDGDNLLDINKIYTKRDYKPNKKDITKISKEISQIIINDFSNNDSDVNITSIDIKNNREKSINKMITILSNNFPEVEGDHTIQISLVFIKYGDKTPYKNYMLTLKDCKPLNNCDTRCFKNEDDLLLAYTDIINNENPDIITGWNTNGFDTPWLFKRAEELDIHDDFSNMSQFMSYSSVLKEKQIKGPTGQLITQEFVDIPGRTQMDLLPLVQKSYNLDSYKLDTVAAEFINGKITKLEYIKDIDSTIVYTSSITGLNNNNFVIFNQTEGYLKKKYMDGKKFEIYNKDIEKSTFCIKGHLDMDINNTSWCLGKDDVSPKDIFRLQKGTDSDRAIIAKYCLMDTVLCIELMNKLEILTNNIGMANVCKIPLSWIIQRGQGVRILSLMAYFLRKKDYLIPFLYKDTFGKEGYEGAVVLDPKPGIYIDKPVAVLDYGSLYPSSMIEFNISHETIVDNEEYLGESGGKLLEKEGYLYKDVTYDRYKTLFTPAGAIKGKMKIGTTTVRFVQYKDGSKGLLPEILRYLLTARKTTRNKAKYKTIVTDMGNTYTGIYKKECKTIETPDKTYTLIEGETVSELRDTYNDFQKNVLDGLQAAFKVTANSLYGQVGAKTSDLYYQELAASTTAVGRDRLLLAKNFALDKNNYPQILKNGETIYLKNEIIYGDTDSIFVHFQSLDENGVLLKGRDARVRNIELAQYTEHQIQKILEHPQNLEYEKTFDPFILISKKRYVGHLYEINPDKYKIKSMGLVTKRRDNAPIVKVIYGGIIDIIMQEKNIVPAANYFRKVLRDLIKGKYGLDTLVISKTLSAFYKDPDRIAHKVLADRMAERDPGNKPQINDRIPYIYIQTCSDSKLQGDKIETPKYIKEHNLVPDYEFYITNQIMKPVTQIFALCLDKIPGYRNNIDKLNSTYDDYIKKGKTENEAIKRMIECKRKEAQDILLNDILRLLQNKRLRNNEITSYFKIK